MLDIFSLILFILPSYVANAVPVVLGGGTLLDFNKKFFDGELVFGEGKTIRGFVAGVMAGTLIAALLANYMLLPFFENKQKQFLGGFMLALGTMVGDAFGSFIKRRLKKRQGSPFFLDTFLFVIIAMMLAYPYTLLNFYNVENVGIIIGLTLIMHPLFNIIANKMGLKKVPW